MNDAALFKPVTLPRVAVIGLALDLYRRTLPGLMGTLRRQLALFAAPLRGRAEPVFTRLCYLEEEVAGAVAEAERQQLDACVVIPLCYVASLVSVRSLAHTPVPVVIWNTQALEGFDATFDFTALGANHVTQGTQDVTSVLVRSGRPFGMESGHYRDAGALDRLAEWLRAARAARFARRLRVGLVGAPFADMGDFGIDSTRMALRWGPHAVPLSVGRFAAELRAVRPAEVRRLMAADRRRFRLDRSVTAAVHRDSALVEAATRRLVAEYRLDAMSVNFLDIIDDGRCPTMPFFGINKLMGEGLGYAGEGDILTAAFMAQARQLCGAVTFTEMFTVDYRQDRVLMTHMQECNPALARRDRPVRLLAKPFWAPGIRPYVGMHFTLEPGPVTLAAPTLNPQGDLQVVAAEGHIEDMDPLPRFDIPHWSFRVGGPVGEFLTRYSQAGGPHHLVGAPGRHAGALRKLGALQGFACTVL